MRPTIRTCYYFLGWLFFSIGFVGAFLPVLPTTSFMILALWMFSKSSERFHDWLYQHEVFGPPLQNWVQHKAIPTKAKILAVSMMSLSFGYLLLYSAAAGWLIVLAAIFMGGSALFIVSKPSTPAEARRRASRIPAKLASPLSTLTH